MSQEVVPTVIEPPAFYQFFPGYPVYVSEPDFKVSICAFSHCPVYMQDFDHITKKDGYTHIHAMIPSEYVGVLIGRNGDTIESLKQYYGVHTQFWKENHVFEEAYNLPTIWTLEYPSFIIHGPPINVYGLLVHFCWIIGNMKYVLPSRKMTFDKGEDTLSLYKDQRQRYSDYLERNYKSFPSDILQRELTRICDNSACNDTKQIVKFIMEQYNRDEICLFLMDYNHFVSFLVTAEILINNETTLSRDNLSALEAELNCKKTHRDDSYQTFYDLTEEEELDGERFFLECCIRDCFA